MRGLTRSVVFERDRNRLVGQGYELCSFVPMQGAGTPFERLVSLDRDEVSLRVDGNQPVDADGLRAALSQPGWRYGRVSRPVESGGSMAFTCGWP
jgi:protein-L-isoaspartate(D-aspartate) O-methyltransferase